LHARLYMCARVRVSLAAKAFLWRAYDGPRTSRPHQSKVTQGMDPGARTPAGQPANHRASRAAWRQGARRSQSGKARPGPHARPPSTPTPGCGRTSPLTWQRAAHAGAQPSWRMAYQLCVLPSAVLDKPRDAHPALVPTICMPAGPLAPRSGRAVPCTSKKLKIQPSSTARIGCSKHVHCPVRSQTPHEHEVTPQGFRLVVAWTKRPGSLYCCAEDVPPASAQLHQTFGGSPTNLKGGSAGAGLFKGSPSTRWGCVKHHSFPTPSLPLCVSLSTPQVGRCPHLQ
jgi:hypothetical protein